MNLITIDTTVTAKNYIYTLTEVHEGERGAQGATGDQGQAGASITDANITDGRLVFTLDGSTTDYVGEYPVARLQNAFLGEINGENKTFFIAHENPICLLINGIQYRSDFVRNGNQITTTFGEGEAPTGDVYLIYKELK